MIDLESILDRLGGRFGSSFEAFWGRFWSHFGPQNGPKSSLEPTSLPTSILDRFRTENEVGPRILGPLLAAVRGVLAASWGIKLGSSWNQNRVKSDHEAS